MNTEVKAVAYIVFSANHPTDPKAPLVSITVSPFLDIYRSKEIMLEAVSHTRQDLKKQLNVLEIRSDGSFLLRSLVSKVTFELGPPGTTF